jgi:tetratricopeptide (TPR) repeat protein
MAYAPAIPLSRRWRSSLRRGTTALARLLIGLILLLPLAAAAWGEGTEAAKRSLLLLPTRSHWTAAPLADAISQALPDALTAAGYAVVVMAPDSAEFKLAVSEGWLKPEDLAGDRVGTLRHSLAVASECQASLLSEVVETDSETVLRAELAGAVSHRGVPVEASLPFGSRTTGGPGREQVVRDLATALAAKLTAEVWTQAGADEAGASAGAPDRFTAGQSAFSTQRYQDALLEFDAALAGKPDNPDYLKAAADAELALNRPVDALPLLRRLCDLRPGDREALLQLGEAALSAKQPDEAEAVFSQAAEIEPPDPRAIEGMARAARAQGQRDRAERDYARLIGMLPALAGAPSWLPSLLASQRGEGIVLTSSDANLDRALGRIYLSNGYYPEGVKALLASQQPDSPAYNDQDYLAIASNLDQEGETVARRVGAIIAHPVAELKGDALSDELDALHDRSDRLATLAEKMRVSDRLDPAHRYRVLSYNLLNQSDFEGLMFFQTHDPDLKRRSDLLRDAFRKARTLAQDLAKDLTGRGK